MGQRSLSIGKPNGSTLTISGPYGAPLIRCGDGVNLAPVVGVPVDGGLYLAAYTMCGRWRDRSELIPVEARRDCRGWWLHSLADVIGGAVQAKDGPYCEAMLSDRLVGEIAAIVPAGLHRLPDAVAPGFTSETTPTAPQY